MATAADGSTETEENPGSPSGSFMFAGKTNETKSAMVNPALERGLIQSEETNKYLAGITRGLSGNKQSYTWVHLRDSCG